MAFPFSAADVDLPAFAEWREDCRRLGFLPVFRHELLLQVALVAPFPPGAVAAIRQLTHQEVRAFGISREDFDQALELLEPGAVAEPDPGAEAEMPPPSPESWDSHRRSGREIALDLVRFAHASRASDLLLDEQEGWLDVALQVDGRKEMLPPVAKAAGSALLRAFKQLAGISTQSSPAPRSGSASVAVGPGRQADLRVELIPTVQGESLVARVQDRARQLERMRQLPFDDPGQRARVEECLGQSQGLILVTGPTGQGKTTTLYACLGRLDRSVLNIRTLEDPVEFIVPWITQIPVGSGTGRDFGEGLKSLLRQAPHVILLGEIRDPAVAQTCVAAVDTGHLILATLHTRSAVGAVARLVDLGLTGRQVSGALLLVVGQRLLRRLCPHCRRPVPATTAQQRQFVRHRLPPPAELWLAVGCPRCGGRGERGRVPVFELLHPASCGELSEKIGRSSREKLDESALRSCWMAGGGSPLVREGLRRAAAGEVTHAEVLQYEGTAQ